jgi:hypothetical protein
VGVIIDSSSLEVPDWEQKQYNEFWREVLERHVRRVIFLDGWHYSHGCTLEFETAQRLELDCVDERLQELNRDNGIRLVTEAAREIEALGLDASVLTNICERLAALKKAVSLTPNRVLYKDEVLDHLAHTANVAQFVSFGPGNDLRQRYCRIRGYPENHQFNNAAEAIGALLERAPENKVNIRSYYPDRPEGNPFIKRLSSVDEVVSALKRLSAEGLHTLVNESIDEGDGGVSGVAYRGVLEFAPDATPRCVDDDNVETCALPFELGMSVLSSVYMFEPDLRGRDGTRVEFSVHPMPRGWLHRNTILWQAEQRPAPPLEIEASWPNRFSRMLGDKAFGLAVAAAAGLPVPRTVVFSRRLFPFAFGQSTGTGTLWTRPSPTVKTPGYYQSFHAWRDPNALLADSNLLEQPSGRQDPHLPPVASILIQESVEPVYSGKLIPADQNNIHIDGVAGSGDAFMIGDVEGDPLPQSVVRAVRQTHEAAVASVGICEIEWVFDGTSAWVVQINPYVRSRRLSATSHTDLNATEWEEFVFAKSQLEQFRTRVRDIQGTGKGLTVIGNVSPLSHVAEIADVHGVPVRFVKPSIA